MSAEPNELVEHITHPDIWRCLPLLIECAGRAYPTRELDVRFIATARVEIAVSGCPRGRPDRVHKVHVTDAGCVKIQPPIPLGSEDEIEEVEG